MIYTHDDLMSMLEMYGHYGAVYDWLKHVFQVGEGHGSGLQEALGSPRQKPDGNLAPGQVDNGPNADKLLKAMVDNGWLTHGSVPTPTTSQAAVLGLQFGRMPSPEHIPARVYGYGAIQSSLAARKWMLDQALDSVGAGPRQLTLEADYAAGELRALSAGAQLGQEAKSIDRSRAQTSGFGELYRDLDARAEKALSFGPMYGRLDTPTDRLAVFGPVGAAFVRKLCVAFPAVVPFVDRELATLALQVEVGKAIEVPIIKTPKAKKANPKKTSKRSKRHGK